jgi:hypothetical protein
MQGTPVGAPAGAPPAAQPAHAPAVAPAHALAPGPVGSPSPEDDDMYTITPGQNLTLDGERVQWLLPPYVVAGSLPPVRPTLPYTSCFHACFFHHVMPGKADLSIEVRHA